MDICIYIYIWMGRRKGEKSRVFWPRVLSLLSGLRWATFYTTSYSRLIVTRWMQYDIKRGRNSITGYTRSATKELGFSFSLPFSLSLFSFLFNFLENSRLAPMLLSLSRAVSFFRTVLLKSRPCCMFKKESLEFDIGTPRYCLRSRLKIRRLRNRVFFWNARLLSPPLSFSVYYPIPPSTIKRHFSFDSVSFLRRKYSTLGGCYFNMRIYRGGIIGSGIGCAFRLHGISVDVNAYPLIEENGSSLWFCFWVKKSIVFKFNFRRICVLLGR